MVLGRCLTIEETYKAIDWKIIFLLVGILPLGLALEQNGAALWIANTLNQVSISFEPVTILAIFYIVTAMLTETMSNTAAAAILAPIAISVGLSMNVDPRPFLVAITFAASTSFATPIGYQTNTMVYAPGGYRFTDFLRIGGPLNLIFWGIAVLLIPMLWSF
jgi:di/tricarboxylate transporter